MKEPIIGGRSMLVGDAIADAVVEYTAVLAQTRRVDTVPLNAFTPDGRAVDVFFPLSSATVVLAQSNNDRMEPEPDNNDALQVIHAALTRLNPYSTEYLRPDDDL